MLSTTEYFKIEGDILLLEVDGHYYFDLSSLSHLLGLSLDAQLQAIDQDENLQKGFEEIEVKYRNNKKDTVLALKVEFLAQWLFRVSEENVKPEFRNDIQRIKDEAVRLVNENVLKASKLDGNELHQFRQQAKDARERKETLSKEVQEIEDQLKSLEKHKEAMDKEVNKGTEPVHQYRSKAISAKNKVDELQNELNQKKPELKKQEERHYNYMKKNNVGRNILLNLFSIGESG